MRAVSGRSCHSGNIWHRDMEPSRLVFPSLKGLWRHCFKHRILVPAIAIVCSFHDTYLFSRHGLGYLTVKTIIYFGARSTLNEEAVLNAMADQHLRNVDVHRIGMQRWPGKCPIGTKKKRDAISTVAPSSCTHSIASMFAHCSIFP